jgi:hypothetical protein
MGSNPSISVAIEIPCGRNFNNQPATFRYYGPNAQYRESLDAFSACLRELIEAMRGMNSDEAAEILRDAEKSI